MNNDATNKIEEIIEEADAKTTAPAVVNKGRELSAKKSTLNLDDGEYNATITEAFNYKNENGLDRVMLVFKLEDGTEFKYIVADEWIDKYPFSVIISQSSAKYVEDFVGLNVTFKIRNKKGDYLTFSNIKRIALRQ